MADKKQVRGAYRGHSTRDIKKAEAIMDSSTPNKTELKLTKERLARRMLELQEWIK